MTENNYNWTTEFINGDIIHTFSDRVKVILTNKGTSIRVYKDKNLVVLKNIIYVHEYEKLLLEVAKDAATMKQFEVQEP